PAAPLLRRELLRWSALHPQADPGFIALKLTGAGRRHRKCAPRSVRANGGRRKTARYQHGRRIEPSLPHPRCRLPASGSSGCIAAVHRQVVARWPKDASGPAEYAGPPTIRYAGVSRGRLVLACYHVGLYTPTDALSLS